MSGMAETGPFPGFTNECDKQCFFFYVRHYSPPRQPHAWFFFSFFFAPGWKQSQLIYGNVLWIRCHNSEEQSMRSIHILHNGARWTKWRERERERDDQMSIGDLWIFFYSLWVMQMGYFIVILLWWNLANEFVSQKNRPRSIDSTPVSSWTEIRWNHTLHPVQSANSNEHLHAIEYEWNMLVRMEWKNFMEIFNLFLVWHDKFIHSFSFIVRTSPESESEFMSSEKVL